MSTEQDRRKRKAEYMREWRRKNPQKERAAQIRKAQRLLIKAGYTVTVAGIKAGEE